MQLFEMQGLLAGKYLPGDMKVNESLAEYLLRKLEDRNELERQLSAKTISEQNIINAFGISGEGAHSKLVIEYVHGLVAENVALKKYAKIDDYDKCDNCGFESYVMPIETPNTDAFTAELRAQGVDELAEAWEAIKPKEGVSMSESTALKYKQRAQDAREFAANLRAGRKG